MKESLKLLQNALPTTDGEPGNGSPLSNTNTSLEKLSVLMPLFNERWTLRQIISKVLAAPISLEIELIVVDDASTDGSWELLQTLAEEDTRINALQHEKNRGKGTAIRTAIEHMTGDVAVVQDADLEYDPHDYAALLEPILAGKADAVFGSRYAGDSRRVQFFWHSLVNHFLTFLSNLCNNLNLTDMETCYKMVRADVLKNLRLKSNTFTLEPELTCRLAQAGARIYEVPVSYDGRTFAEGKKIRPIDGVKAVWEMLRSKFLDPQFTEDAEFYTLSSEAKASGCNRWILKQVAQYMGKRVLEAGSGIGNLSTMLLNRERLVLVDDEEAYTSVLQQRFSSRENIRIDQADLTNPQHFRRWHQEDLDTVFCSNVLEQLQPDVEVLESFHQTVKPGGHCIIVVPAGRWLYTGMDEELGHCRRYTQDDLRQKMTAAGFDVVFTRQFNRLGSLSWSALGHVMRRRHLSLRQMRWFDRILPIVKLLEYILPVPGMSLIMVGRKPVDAAKMAA